MKKTILTLALTLFTFALSAKQYPDSVREASAKEHTIESGFTFDVEGGIGLGGSTFSFTEGAPANHSTNKIGFPDWNAGIGINYYFVSCFGLGTGLDFATYRNVTAITAPYTATGTDKYGVQQGEYTLTSTPNSIREKQTLRYLEVPLMLKFRYQPKKVVGFQANMGVKLAFPMMASYSLNNGGSFENSVYYPHWDLTMSNIPNVITNQTVSSGSGTIDRSELAKINYVGHLEMGMLFRLHQRVDMSLMFYGDYFFNDAMPVSNRTTLGYTATSAGMYPSAFPTTYQGVLYSSEVASLHPWDVGIKVGFHFHTGCTKAERKYNRQQREARKLAKLAPIAPVPTDTVEPIDSAALWEQQREQAIEEIRSLAQTYNIDLCEMCGMSTIIVHDTVFVHIEKEIAPVPTAVERVDSMLQSAVIYFHFDKYVPILEPQDILIRLAAILRQHPNLVVHVDGHASIEGKAAYNKKLALRRAQAVAAELRKLGVLDSQMIVATYGADQPFRYHGSHINNRDRRVEVYPEGETPTHATEGDDGVATSETAREGSRLAQVARRHYGKPEYWVFIWEANFDKVPNPDVLSAGINLLIPDLKQRLDGATDEEIRRLLADTKAQLQARRKK